VVPVNTTDEYKMSFDTSQRARIPRADNNSSAYDYFASFYANGAFIVKKRYTFSFSARMDRSNLFGANINGNSKPLGSIGFKWDLNEEPLYHLRSVIPFLSLRTSYGSSGNISKNTTAYVSAMASQMAQGTLYTIISPANPDLCWEESRMFNAGISLNDYHRHYFFDFDYYTRRSRDLMGPGAQDATYGLDAKWGNYASLKGQGWDLSFKTIHDIRKFKIENLLLLSRSVNTVTNYYNVHKDAGYFVDNTYLRPREGYPVHSIYAFPWAGLDPSNGDPMGYQKGNATNQYQDLFSALSDSLVFKGSATPTLWGTLRPSIAKNNWKLSFTLSGKFDYAFRRSSVNYSNPYTTRIAGRNDFSRRWKPDNKNADVPSLKLTPNGDRDFFYSYSEILVEKGDHIRLQDVRFDYDCSSLLNKWKLQKITAYVYASNLGILWSANKLHIDPDYQYGSPPGKAVTVGFTVDF
jgi:TonB-dependent starch-binding outer membrane protein SusC